MVRGLNIFQCEQKVRMPLADPPEALSRNITSCHVLHGVMFLALIFPRMYYFSALVPIVEISATVTYTRKLHYMGENKAAQFPNVDVVLVRVICVANYINDFLI